MSESDSKRLECGVCGYVYDEATEGVPWEELPADWECPLCGAGKDEFEPVEAAPEAEAGSGNSGYLSEWARPKDEREEWMAAIHSMAVTGESITEPMRTPLAKRYWDDVLIKGAQLARLPLDETVPVRTHTTLGPRAAFPLELAMPVYVSHMSFGALSKEAKLAMARGSAAVKTATCSGEGGIIPESLDCAYRYVFEYVPNRYSLTDENLERVAAVEIKIGQSAKPGMGGHLPGEKVTEEIAAVRGFPVGQSITSPASYSDIRDGVQLAEKVAWLREKTGGKPIGIKLAAGNLEADLAIAVAAGPDFITVDGRPGATAAAPRFIKAATSIPTLFALHRARKFLDETGAGDISLVITGGLRVSSDFAKALAMGADAVAVASAAMIAVGCQQYRVCHTGRCPVGIATQDPELRARLDVEQSAARVANYFRAVNEELQMFARLTGHKDVHELGIGDLCTVSSEISGFTDIEHV